MKNLLINYHKNNKNIQLSTYIKNDYYPKICQIYKEILLLKEQKNTSLFNYLIDLFNYYLSHLHKKIETIQYLKDIIHNGKDGKHVKNNIMNTFNRINSVMGVRNADFYKIKHKTNCDDELKRIFTKIDSNYEFISQEYKNYDTENILSSNYLMSNMIDELKDYHCICMTFNINMKKKNGKHNFYLISYPKYLCSTRKMFSDLNRNIIDIKNNEPKLVGFTNDSSSKYNIMIPLFINKKVFVLSEYYLKKLCDIYYYNFIKNSNTNSYQMIFNILFDYTLLLFDKIKENDFKNVEFDLKQYFIFWLTCNRMYVKNKLNIENHKYSKTIESIPLIFGQIISTGYNEKINLDSFMKMFINVLAKKYGNINKLLDNPDEIIMSFYKIYVFMKFFHSCNINNIICELCRTYSILDSDILTYFINTIKEIYNDKKVFLDYFVKIIDKTAKPEKIQKFKTAFLY